MSVYPSAIGTLSSPNATDKLSSPSHSQLENGQNTQIIAVENFLGLEGSASTLGTLVYDIRSPGSNGGGHIQAANKGGTGQTSFNKGDLLVGQSSSVITKLTVGQDTFIPSANSSTASGIEWVANSRPKVSTSASVITLIGNVNETSILSVTVPGSTLGISNAIRTTAYITNWNPRSSVMVNALYGGGVVASVILNIPSAASASYDSAEAMAGQIGYTMISNNSTNSQRVFLSVQVIGRTTNTYTNSSVYNASNSQVSSIASDAPQVLGITVKESIAGDGFVMGGTIVEKIN